MGVHVRLQSPRERFAVLPAKVTVTEQSRQPRVPLDRANPQRRLAKKGLWISYP